MPARHIYAFLFVGLFLSVFSEALHAQRQAEALGRGVVAVRTSSTQTYVGWRLLGDDPTDVTFHVYRTIGTGAATRITTTPVSTSTNVLDTPGSTALAGPISYAVAPVIGGVEQARSAGFTLAANSATPSTSNRTRPYLTLPLATAFPNPASPANAYDVKFCWVGDFDGDGEYDFLVDRLSTVAAERQYLEAYKRDGTFLWRMDMGPNSIEQYAYEPGSSAISVGDTDNVTVYDFDGDGRAEVAVRTANGVVVTNASGQTVATITAASNTAQFVSIIDGLSGAERGRVALPNPWAQHGTLTSKCAVAYLDGVRPSVIFYGYNRADSGAFYRVFSAFDFRAGALTLRWTTPQTFAGAEGHQIRVADVDNDGRDEIIDIGHVIDDNGTQLFVIPEISHGDRFHVADLNPDRPGLENYIIQQNNPSFLATAYYDAGTGRMLKKWYATDVVDVGRGIALDMTSAHKGYEMYSTQPGIYNARGEQIYANTIWAPEGLWWDADLLREFIDGPNSGATSPVINKFNAASGGNDRLWNLYSSSVHQAYGGRPAFWGDILGDWREEVVVVANDYASLRIFTTSDLATTRLYTLMHNPAYRMQATTKGYVQGSNVDYYLGAGMTTPPPPPMVRSDLVWSGGPSGTAWDIGGTASWRDASSGVSAAFADGRSVRFDIAGSGAAPISLTGELRPSALAVYSPHDYTLDGAAGSLAGSMSMTKAGQGILRITGTHSFTGPSTVWDGALQVDGSLNGSNITVWGGTWGGPLARGLTGGRLAGSGVIARPVSVLYRGTITPGAGMGKAGTLTLGNGLSATDGATLAFDVSNDPTGIIAASDRLQITGNLTLSGTVSLLINPLSGSLAPGAYTLATYSGTLTGSVSNVAVTIPDGTPYALALGSGALTLTIPETRPPASVAWTGAANGTWDLAATANWSRAAAADVFVAGDSVTFGDAGAGRTAVTLNVAAPVAGLVFSGSANYTIAGSGAIAGPSGLVKSGSGVVTLNTTNTFTGPVTITGGVLAVANLADGGEASSLGASTAAASNLTLNGGTLRLVGSQTNTNRGLTLGAAGGTIDNAATLQISGGITGTGALTKTGTGTFILANANTHSGGTILQAGTLVLASDTANTNGLGTGGLTLQGGTLRMYDNTGSYNTSSWSMTVPTGASARFEADGRSTLAGTLSGSGSLEFYTTYVRTEVTGNWSAFAGTLSLVTDSDGGDFRINNTFGLPAATLQAGAGSSTYSIRTSNHTFALGSLSGVGRLGGIDTAGRVVTWQIGAKNIDSTFSGVIANNAGAAALTKVGTGTLTLSGASTYTGATTISAGRLLLSGGSLSGTTVSVASSAGFGGAGSVTGNVTFATGSTLLASTSGPLAVTGNLILPASVTIAPALGSTFPPGTYLLYTCTGTITGGTTFTWSGSGLSASFDTSTPGQVSMTLQTSVAPPSDVVARPASGAALLSWQPSPSASSYTILRAATAAGPFAVVASDRSGQSHTDTGLSDGRTYFYRVRAVAADGSHADSDVASVSVGGSTAHARWRFDEPSGASALSDVPPWQGTLANTPSRVAGRINTGLNLVSASSQHVTLPTGVIASLNDFTLSLWVRVATQATWSRIVDFGSGTTNYLFLASRASDANNFPRFAIRTPAVAEQIITSNVALPVGVWTHLAVTLSGTTGTLYLNGVAVGSNSAMTLTPSSLGATTQNYFGRSQFAADPYFNGVIDEVAWHGRALMASEIAALASPPPAPNGLGATPGVGNVNLVWSRVDGADSYAVLRQIGDSPYTVIAENLGLTAYTDGDRPAGVLANYVVRARRWLADSPWSMVASAAPLPTSTLIELWRQTYFGITASEGEAADDADPDHDGLVNMLEYALGADPTNPSPGQHPVIAATLGLPPSLVFSFNRINDPDLQYEVQATDSLLGTWQVIWSSTGSANVSGLVQVPDTVPLNPGTRRFLRLRVTSP